MRTSKLACGRYYFRSGAQAVQKRESEKLLDETHAEESRENGVRASQSPAGRLLAQVDKAAVDPLLGHELIVGPALRDPSRIEHDDLVGAAHGVQAVRYRDERFASRGGTRRAGTR